MSRMQELRMVDPVLTNLAAGYINDEFIADLVLPPVPVVKEGGKKLMSTAPEELRPLYGQVFA